MIKNKEDFITKTHMIISVLIVVPIAFIYGFNPDTQFNIHLNTIDEHNAFKAIMGLYLGFSILWVLGIFQKKYLKLALVSNMIFMLGLGFGRLLSLALDGTPTFAYVFGTFGELVLGFYGAWVLKTRY
ncbi:DUF4345 domain-containing protein [uncultured Algibacter sp.]|uniref:DUF4345 domain-containing protein n=1 Tax=uncultured Algibacter sp. TaxID=298659 RepID=UPI0026215FA9|nr:DUF4345 domain-containing protein [uncultured Algibacter sp.]